MKAKKILKAIIVCTWILLFCIPPSTLAQEKYREPFTNNSEEVFNNTLPSESSPTTSAGRTLKAPPSQGGNPLGVEAPAKDASWALMVAALLYGLYKRRKIEKRESELSIKN